jgi:DNA-binding response OmpR family regulator
MKAPADCNVLVVEDDFMVGLLVTNNLMELGFTQIAHSCSVAEALAWLKANTADVAILDVNLGREFSYPIAEQLLARGVPFVFATGYADAAIPETWRDRPKLNKPFSVVEMKAALAGLSFGS